MKLCVYCLQWQDYLSHIETLKHWNIEMCLWGFCVAVSANLVSFLVSALKYTTFISYISQCAKYKPKYIRQMLTCLKLKHYINQNDWNTSYITFDVCRDSMKNHYMHITEPSWTELNGALLCSSKKHKIIYISNTYRCVRTSYTDIQCAHCSYIHRVTVVLHVCTARHTENGPIRYKLSFVFVDIFEQFIRCSRALLQIVIVFGLGYQIDGAACAIPMQSEEFWQTFQNARKLHSVPFASFCLSLSL